MLQVGDTYESRSGQQKQILAIEGTGCYAEVTYKVVKMGTIPNAHKPGIRRTVTAIRFKSWLFKKVEV